jgi:hypothetical protein
VPYSAEISRASPAAFVFLLDQSASMQDPFGGAEQKGDAAPSKARVLADTVNRLLRDLVLRCAKEEGVRDYFHVGVVGYGERVQPLIEPAESHGAPGGLVPISALADRPKRVEERPQQERSDDGEKEERAPVRFPVWFDPHAKNGTPMCQALDRAARRVRRWIDAHPKSFPPVVVNVTDGEATDGEPLRYARQLRDFATDDGATLLFNVHLSESEDPAVELPSDPDELPDEEYAEQLFQMSSRLPFAMRSAAEQEGYRVDLDTRGFVFNADPGALVRFLDIGTRPSNLR